MNFNYSTDEIVNWSNYYNELKPPADFSIDDRFTEFGDWSVCKEECGFQNQARSRFLLPAVYGGNRMKGLDSSELFETRPCNKFCRSEEDVLRLWKEYTGCPASRLPEVTNQKLIKSVDDSGAEVEFESAVYIDNLRYYSEEQLKRVFDIWKPTDNADVSRDCYGNELSFNTVLYIGSKIYSKNGVSYLEYSVDGAISFYSLKTNGDIVAYEKSKELRKAVSDTSRAGSYMKLLVDRLIIYNSAGSKIYEMNLTGGREIECKLVVGETGLLVVDRKNNVVNVIGGIQSEYYVKDSEFVFKSLPSGEYAVLSNPTGTSYLSLSSAGVKLVNDGKIINQLVKDSVSLSIILNKNGMKIVNGDGSVLFQLKVSDCSIISLYGNNIEFYSTVNLSTVDAGIDCLCGYIGTSMSLLTEDYKIKKPQSVEEEFSCRFECVVDGVVKSQLVYSSDGELSFKVSGETVWSAGTKQKPSTHFYVYAGEIFIMNNSSIVFRSNSNVSEGVTFLLLSELFLLLLNQREELELVRIYPNYIKSSTKGWNCIKTIGAFYLESNYDKYPALSIRSKYNVGNGIGITTSLVDISSYVAVSPESECPPLDLFCRSNKAESVNTSTGLNTYSVELDVNDNKWKSNVKTVSMTNPSINVSFDYNSTSAYLYANKKILGYDLVVEEENLGDYSTPFVYIKTNSGTTAVRLIMKKQVDEFIADIIESSSAEDFMNNLSKETIFNGVIAAMFGIKLHSNFKFDTTMSSFSDDDIANQIMQTRVDMLENACMNKNMLSDNCQAAFNKLTFYSKRAKKYYDLTMELECRKDFINPHCYNYIPSSTGVINFINNYCGKVKNAFSSHCTKICTSPLSHLFEKCTIRDNIYIFVLIVVLVVVLSIKRVNGLFHLNFLKTNTNAKTTTISSKT